MQQARRETDGLFCEKNAGIPQNCFFSSKDVTKELITLLTCKPRANDYQPSNPKNDYC